MKRLSLIITLLLAVLLLQKCKKDTYSAYATSNNTMFAVINDTTWSADTIHAVITYNAASKSKIFTCTGIANNKEVNISITLPTSTNTPGFPLTTYNADATGNNLFSYYTKGNGGFVELGTVAPGSGTIAFTTVDSVKKVLTGTFSLVSEKKNYDTGGNLISVTISEVAAGAFNSMPYTFVSN
jgi:hypothetical protein